MWTRILLMPWRQRAFVAAGVDAVLNMPDWLVRGLGPDPHELWLFALLHKVMGIAIFGLVVAACTQNSHRAYTNALAGLDPAQRLAALEASFGGPVPVDAPVRDAAIRVTRRRLTVARSWRVVGLILVGLLLVGVLQLAAHPALSTRLSELDAADWFDIALAFGLAVTACYASLNAEHRLQLLGRGRDSITL